MTDEQKKYVLDNWKKLTVSQLAQNITSKGRVIHPSEVHNFLTKQNISPVTKRDLITKEVIEIYGNETTVISAIAKKLNVCKQLIMDIIEENGLTVHKTKPGPRNKEEEIDHTIEAKKRIENLNKKKNRSEEIKANRASFTVYNQTGSPILDELRNIKTTEREKTLLSTGLK